MGNTLTLHETALIEAFNLKAAIEYILKNVENAKEALTDMPPRYDLLQNFREDIYYDWRGSQLIFIRLFGLRFGALFSPLDFLICSIFVVVC